MLGNVLIIRERQKKQAIEARLKEEDDRMNMFQKLFRDNKKKSDVESDQGEFEDASITESAFTDSEV